MTAPLRALAERVWIEAVQEWSRRTRDGIGTIKDAHDLSVSVIERAFLESRRELLEMVRDERLDHKKHGAACPYRTNDCDCGLFTRAAAARAHLDAALAELAAYEAARGKVTP